MMGQLLCHRLLRQNDWPGRSSQLIPSSYAKKEKKLSVIQSTFLEEKVSGLKIQLNERENGKFVQQLTCSTCDAMSPRKQKRNLSPQVYQYSETLIFDLFVMYEGT